MADLAGRCRSANQRPVVQYRGAVLPLRPADPSADAPRLLEGASDTVNVVVHSDGGRSVGFVVDELLDIVEERFVVQDHVGGRPGVAGTAVIGDRVARVLDLERATTEEAQ